MRYRCGRLSAGSLLVSLCLLATRLASADVGVYLHSFDPIQQAQLDGALLAKERLKLDSVLLIPDFREATRESLETRRELLEVAVQGDPRFKVPSAAQMSELVDKKNWEALIRNYDPKLSSVVQIHDQGNPQVWKKIQLSKRVKRPQVLLHQKGRKPKTEHGVHRYGVLTDPAAGPSFVTNPVLKESLLPRAAADLIRERKMYGHDGSRGYYGLPARLTRQVDFEQTLNDRIEDTSEFESVHESTLPREYNPDTRPVFPIYTVDVPKAAVTAIRTGKETSYRNLIQGETSDTVRFYVHPYSKPLFEEAFQKHIGSVTWKQQYLATPTSSHRSLLVWDPADESSGFGLKSTLDAKIGGSLRHLNRWQIEGAAATSALVNTLDREALNAKGIQIIDEPVGVYLKGFERGFAIRELPTPNPDTDLIPMFSFYSKPNDAPPMVVQAIAQSGLSPKEFADKFLIKPLTEQFSHLAWEEGMIAEPHEQNILIELKKSDGVPTGRFFYRDLAGFNLNPLIRARKGKDMGFLPKGLSDDFLMIERANPVNNADAYLGHSNFFALQKSIGSYHPEVSKRWVQSRFREHFSAAMERHTGAQARTFAEMRKSYNLMMRETARENCGQTVKAALKTLMERTP